MKKVTLLCTVLLLLPIGIVAGENPHGSSGGAGDGERVIAWADHIRIAGDMMRTRFKDEFQKFLNSFRPDVEQHTLEIGGIKCPRDVALPQYLRMEEEMIELTDEGSVSIVVTPVKNPYEERQAIFQGFWDSHTQENGEMDSTADSVFEIQDTRRPDGVQARYLRMTHENEDENRGGTTVVRAIADPFQEVARREAALDVERDEFEENKVSEGRKKLAWGATAGALAVGTLWLATNWYSSSEPTSSCSSSQ